MSGPINLETYFERLRWGGDTSATFDTLAGLLSAHMARIPFENLDVLLGRPVRLDLAGLQDKLVRGSRGGYCFEHATLFAAVLEQLGFHPVRHAARVILRSPRSESPRGHMFLTVPIDGATFVVDPGFGPYAPRAPVPLADTSTAPAKGETHSMRRDGDLWVLQAGRSGEPVQAWVTTLEAENAIDFEVANHWTATHPASPFVHVMMLSAITPEGRINVMNRDVTIERGNEQSSSQLVDRAQLRALLAESFGFDLPEIERLRVPTIPDWQ
jgi:N-hydroxyarylamine O-acetyltransferase